MHTLRVDRDLGGIELGVIDPRDLAVVSAPPRFYAWVNRSPDERVILTEILDGVSAGEINAMLDASGGVCDLESSFTSSAEEHVILRMRLLRTGQSPVSPLRLIVLDVSEIRRKEEILRTVSDLLDKHKTIIAESRRNLKELLDTLPQAVLMIDSTLRIVSESSSRIETIFGMDIFRKSLLEVMGFSERDLESVILAFSGLRWDLLQDAAPREWHHGDSVYSLSFIPRYQQQKIVSMTVVLDDVTEERRVQDSLARVDAENRTLLAILGAQEEFFDLVDLAHKAVSAIEDPTKFCSIVHDLKGGFSVFECHRLIAMCHEAEGDWRATGYTEQKARLFIHALHEEIRQLLVRFQDSVAKPVGSYEMDDHHRELRVDYRNFVDLINLAQKEQISPNFLDQLEALASRTPAGLLGWLDKLWQKTLRAEGKQGNPIIFRGGIKLPREPYKHLFQTFVHIIRNAADHGIETPEERRASNKSAAGNLEIRCSYSDNMYHFAFIDDGKGINPNEIIRLAHERGMRVSDSITRDEAFLLLCEPEFSSKGTVTEISGRGEGLYAVRRAARAFGGDVAVESTIGKGTTITVRFKQRPHCV